MNRHLFLCAALALAAFSTGTASALEPDCPLTPGKRIFGAWSDHYPTSVVTDTRTVNGTPMIYTARRLSGGRYSYSYSPSPSFYYYSSRPYRSYGHSFFGRSYGYRYGFGYGYGVPYYRPPLYIVR